MKIPINDIWADQKFNISRQPFCPETCAGLAASIGSFGQLQAVSVIPILHDTYKYKLLYGFRRFTAISVILGGETIDCDVRQVKPEDMNDATLLNYIENLERKELTFYEEALGMHNYFAPDTSVTDISRKVNMSRGWVTRRWKLWRLPEEIIAQVREGLLSASDIGIIIQQSPEEQLAKAERIRQGKARGESTRSMEGELTNRSGVMAKKDIQRMMTRLLNFNKTDAMHMGRYTIREINDQQLLGYLGCDPDEKGSEISDRDD